MEKIFSYSAYPPGMRSQTWEETTFTYVYPY